MKAFLKHLLEASILFALLFFIWDIPAVSLFSLTYSIVLIALLVRELGKCFPFKGLILSIMAVQLIISPFLEYYYLENNVFGVMNVADISYFSYVLPCMMVFHLGLLLLYPTQTFEIKLFQLLAASRERYARYGWLLIAVGYIGFIAAKLYPNIPSSLAFIVVILSFMRFIGFFYLWISGARYKWLAFVLVLVPFVFEVIRSTIFIDLIVLSIFFLSVFLMQHKVPKLSILIIMLIGGYSLFVLQSVKYGYRKIVWEEGFSGSAAPLLLGLITEKLTSLNGDELFETAKHVNIRINHGWILSDILANRQLASESHGGSYIYKELIGLLLPRFLYPDKPIVGDREKFKAFTGWGLGRGTAMNVGIMGDGYGNFGYRGGILFCFAFGLFLGAAFKFFYRLSFRYHTLPIWGILIFFYSMRAGNEFYIIGNWIVKTSVVVIAYYLTVEGKNTIRYYQDKLRKPALA